MGHFGLLGLCLMHELLSHLGQYSLNVVWLQCWLKYN